MESRGDAGIADLHCHTRCSDGSDSPAEVLAWAARIGLDVLAITDHDTISGAEEAAELACAGDGPDVIVGEEVSSAEGHIIGLFLASRVAPGMSAAETVAAIQEQGGIAIAAHPFWRVGSRSGGGLPYSVGEEIARVPFDAVEVINGGFTPGMIVANQKAGSAAVSLGYPKVGGSDSHVKHALGWGHTRFEGSTAADLRAAVTAGRTRPGISRIGLDGVRRYAVWSLRRPRVAAVAG